MSTRPDALFKLADTMAENILRTPDEEVLREVAEDYGDPRALANKFDQILERAEKQVAAPPQTRSSFLDLLYRLLVWGRGGTQFQLSSVNSTVWVGAAAVLIVLILGPAVFFTISEFNERSRQLAALEKEQLARSEQLAAQERELLARSEQLAAREKKVLGDVPQMQTQTAIETRPICENLTEPFEHLICADADLAFWQNLVSEIYQHRWRQLDTNGQQILRQGQLDWLRKLRADCNVPETGTWNAAEMARAKSCVLQSTKERVAVLSNN
jgi:uncharacterized protein YecT (DUF1311 family)